MGALDGSTFLYEGGVVSVTGNCFDADDMAAFTSCAAPSIFLSRSNCKVICVEPAVLKEFMEDMPAMVENCFSSGRATLEAMVSGLAPGSETDTCIVGKSTSGNALIGSCL